MTPALEVAGELFILKDCDSRNETSFNGRTIATGWPLATRLASIKTVCCFEPTIHICC